MSWGCIPCCSQNAPSCSRTDFFKNRSERPESPDSPSLLRNGGLEARNSDVRKPRTSLFCFSSVRRASMAPLSGQSRSEPAGTQHIPHALQVVDHGGQADLRLRALQAAEQEARVSEDVVLERCERMLHGGSSQPHHLR